VRTDRQTDRQKIHRLTYADDRYIHATTIGMSRNYTVYANVNGEMHNIIVLLVISLFIIIFALFDMLLIACRR